MVLRIKYNNTDININLSDMKIVNVEYGVENEFCVRNVKYCVRNKK